MLPFFIRSIRFTASGIAAAAFVTVLPCTSQVVQAQTFRIQSIAQIPAAPPVRGQRNMVETFGMSGNGTVALSLSASNSAGLYLSGPQSTDLGTMGSSARGLGVNDAGAVVGYGYPVANGRIHAFVSGDTGLTDLHTTITGLAGVNASGDSYANDINTSGQIAGSLPSQVRPGAGGLDSYLLSADRNTLTNITAAAVSAGGIREGFSYVNALNDAGQVVGQQDFLDEKGLGRVARGYFYSNGAVTRMGLPTGASTSDDAYARGISENGQWVVGEHGGIAVRWQSNGTATSLGILGGFSSSAIGVNDLGLVVGNSFGFAFIYQDGQLMNLNSLLPANSGWTLNTATAINNANQVVGNGFFVNSQGVGISAAYRLNLGNGTISPGVAPEPGSLALLLPAFGGIGLVLRRKRL